ncbi:MAG: hypothetical protein E4H36_15755, partial [Spirochaetales bacterium]
MKRKIFGFLLFSAFVFPAVMLSAAPAGFIIYADGEGFMISRGGKSSFHDIFTTDATGMEVFNGDNISTEKDTYLEIQLASSSNLVKVSENTTFLILSSDTKETTSINLTYGKLRAKVSQLVGNSNFNISGPSATAGVRGTDFGYDYVYPSETGEEDALTQVYCFEGSVEVSKLDKTEEEVKVIETVVINADQMVAIQLKEIARPMNATAITEEIEDFWEIHDFAGSLMNLTSPEHETSIEKTPQVTELQQPQPEEIAPAEKPMEKTPPSAEEKKQQQKILLKKQLNGLGVGLVISGLLV